MTQNDMKRHKTTQNETTHLYEKTRKDMKRHETMESNTKQRKTT